MSSKMGLLISLMFFALFFLLGIDLISIQYIYSDLDSKGVAISYHISNKGEINDDTINEIERTYHVKINEINPIEPKFGDVVEYVISEEFRPVIISKEIMNLSVRRSTVIGYYG